MGIIGQIRHAAESGRYRAAILSSQALFRKLSERELLRAAYHLFQYGDSSFIVFFGRLRGASDSVLDSYESIVPVKTRFISEHEEDPGEWLSAATTELCSLADVPVPHLSNRMKKVMPS